MLNQDEQLESGTSEKPNQSKVSQGDVPSQKKKPEGEAEPIESAESEKGQETIKSKERINESTREDSLGSLAILSDELIVQILSSCDLKDSATVRLINHLFYHFIAPIKLRIWFPRDYHLLLQPEVPINYFVVLGNIYARESGKLSPETFRNIILLIEYFRASQTLPDNYTFFEFIAEYERNNYVSILEWLIRNGHQTLVDYIFTHHILGMFDENGLWSNSTLRQFREKVEATMPDLHFDKEARMRISLWDRAAGCNQLAFMQQQLSDSKKKESLKNNLKKDHDTAIDYAIKHRHFDMMEMLWKFIQENFGNKDILNLPICKEGRSGNSSILHQAAAAGDVKSTLTLLQFVLEVSKGELQISVRDYFLAVFKCLHIAAAKGYLELLKAVITSLEVYYQSHGHDPKEKISNLLYDLQLGRTPYAWAAQFNHQEILQYLFEYDRAAYCKALPSVIEHRSSINNKFSSEQNKVLFCPFQNNVEQNQQISDNSLEIFARLLELDADVNTPDREGITALHYAAKKNDIVAITYLIYEARANVNVIDSQGKTPLHYAVAVPYNVNIKIIQCLVKVGADVNAPDGQGKTPLHYAVEQKSIEVIECLVAAGANVNARDGQGKTPLQYAYDIPMILYTLHDNNPDKELRRKIIDILSAKKESENIQKPESQPQPQKKDRCLIS
jgi:ankyrin repeat protein